MELINVRERHPIPMPMPFGWFQVLFSHELAVGESKPLYYFDTDLVIFRTESGQVSVLDAFCPHMGAHLGYGIHENMGKGARIIGESIQCPFHGWEFGGDGRCTKIPYANNPNPRVARGEEVIRSWPVRELNGCVYVWYHPQRAEPSFEPMVVEEANADNDEWGEPRIHTWDIYTHMQEMAENAVDPAHFKYVHGTNDIPDVGKLEFDGHTRYGFLKTRNPTPRGEVEGSIENANVGPSLSVVRFAGICDTVLMANVTPVNANHTRAIYSFFKKKVNGETPSGGIADAIIDNICQQMEEDKVIWDRKKYYHKPMLCDGDGPFAQMRRWYNQFLVE